MTSVRLIRIYKQMKRNPDKIFSASDFGLSPWKDKSIFKTLIALGLIEKIKFTRTKGILPNTHGYKIINQKEVKTCKNN